MEGIFKSNSFYPQNFFIRTDGSTDIEAIMSTISEAASRLSPESFDAEVKSFIYVLQYQPPYVKIPDFQEIKKLQTEAISKTRFKDEYNGYIGIDISEWVGHFGEEHFINCMGALRKMSKHWKYVFFVKQTADNADTDKAFDLIRGLIWTKELSSDLFSKARLSDRLAEEMSKSHSIKLTLSGQKAVKDIFCESENVSNAVLSDIASDIASYFSGVSSIYSKDIIRYLSDDTYTHFIMSENELTRLKDIIKEGEIKI